MKVCLTCEKEFESKIGRAKFCSNLCRATFHQMKKGFKDGKMTIRIYGLKNPITDQIFYIGKTVGLIETRLQAHFKDTSNTKKTEIIQQILAADKKPEIIEIESIVCETEEEEVAALYREEFWIKDFIEKGGDICNVFGAVHEFKPRLLAEFKKKSYKSEPVGVRMDEEKFKLVCEKEGLTTRQQVVDFLVDKYWWERKLGFVASELPTNGRQPKTKVANLAPPETEKSNFTINTTIKKNFNQLLNDARIGQMNMEEFNRADLTLPQKDLLIRKNNENK